jgi:hypothetical protein
MRRIVGVHGIRSWDRHRAPAAAARALAEEWSAALRPGLGPDVEWQLDMAYYAHRLRVETSQGADDPYTLDEELREQLSAWAGSLALAAEIDQGGDFTLPVRQAIERLSRYSELNQTLIEPFVAVALREVRTYFRNRPARIAAREEVAGAIERSGATIVLAHSLGSVVAYEALAADPLLRIDLLVTLGSPLGLPEVVHDRLEPRDAHTRPLPNVGRWVNVADGGDIVAVPPRLDRIFSGIARNDVVAVGAVAFHRVERYLRSDPVIEELSKSMRPFVAEG